MKKTLTVKLVQDTDARSPQEDGDNGLFLVANHRDFYVAEPGEKRITDDADTLAEKYKKTHWVFPLEAYIHSGVRLALSHCGNFPDRQWDVSQLGFVFVAKSEWRLSAKAREAALSYVGTWNEYLSGDVWGYVVEDEDGETVDSCWGFYGEKYAQEEANSALKYAQDQADKEAVESATWECADLVTA